MVKWWICLGFMRSAKRKKICHSIPITHTEAIYLDRPQASERHQNMLKQCTRRRILGTLYWGRMLHVAGMTSNFPSPMHLQAVRRHHSSLPNQKQNVGWCRMQVVSWKAALKIQPKKRHIIVCKGEMVVHTIANSSGQISVHARRYRTSKVVRAYRARLSWFNWWRAVSNVARVR